MARASAACLEFAPAGCRAHARAIAIMPTLDDAFSTVCEALIEHFGPPPADFEGLAPFEAMIAVLLDRELGGSRWSAALDGLDESGLLTPDRLAEADIPEISDALREQGVVGAGQMPSPRSSIWRAGWWIITVAGSIRCLILIDRPIGFAASWRRSRASG